MVRKILTWIITRYSLNRIIGQLNETQNISEFKKVTVSNQAVIYHDAIAYNNANKPDLINVGKGTHVRGTLLVFKFGGKIVIGENCYIGDNSRIWSAESIEIGDNVLISHGVNIIDTNSHEMHSIERAERYIDLLKNGPWENKGNVITAPVIIKDNAWISFNVIILKGVTIGKGAIVAAGSIVTKDVPDYAIVAGNPAVVVKYGN